MGLARTHPFIDRRENVIENLFRWFFKRAVNHVNQSRFSKLFFERIFRFRDAVRVGNQDVVRAYMNLALLILRLGNETEHSSPRL